MSVLHHIAQFFSQPRPGETLRIPARLWMNPSSQDTTARPDLSRDKQLHWLCDQNGLIVTTQYAKAEPFEFWVSEKPQPADVPPPVEPSAGADTFPCLPETTPAAPVPVSSPGEPAPTVNCSPPDHVVSPDAIPADTSDTPQGPQTPDDL